MMLIINPRPTVNVIVVTVNVIDVDHRLSTKLYPPIIMRVQKVHKSPWVLVDGGHSRESREVAQEIQRSGDFHLPSYLVIAPCLRSSMISTSLFWFIA